MSEDAEMRWMRDASAFLISEAHRCGLVVRCPLRVDGAEWRVELYDPLRFREISTAVGTIQEVIRLMDLYQARQAQRQQRPPRFAGDDATLRVGDGPPIHVKHWELR